MSGRGWLLGIISVFLLFRSTTMERPMGTTEEFVVILFSV